MKHAIGYGVALWAIPFAISFLIFPLKESGSPLFETIMPVTLTFCVTVFTILYFQKVESEFRSESIKIGVIWLLISIVIDLTIFMWGPMKMTFIAYMLDIGLTYIIFPIVTVGAGYILENKITS
jgi:EamA domain-containing membrane protein RarD